MAKKIINTPWGRADHVEQITEGIHRVDTPSHGGYHVDDTRRAMMPAAVRNYVSRYHGQIGWFEEDCEWTLVALCFPAHFPDSALITARAIAAKLYPAELAAIESTDTKPQPALL